MNHASVRIAAVGIALLMIAGCSSGRAESGEAGQTQAVTATVLPSALTPTPTVGPTASKGAQPSAHDAYEPATPEHPAKNVPKPVMPKIAREGTTQGQEAFIRYYFDAINYAVETRDPSILYQITHPDCVYCGDIVGITKNQAKKGIYTVGIPFKVTSVFANPTPNPQNLFESYALVDEPAFQTIQSDGKQLEPNEPKTQVRWTVTTYFNSVWIMYKLLPAYEAE